MTHSDYIRNVGGGIIALLTRMSHDDEAMQIVADTMRMPVPQVTAILDKLLEKIDNGQVTTAEVALILTAPAADEE